MPPLSFSLPPIPPAAPPPPPVSNPPLHERQPLSSKRKRPLLIAVAALIVIIVATLFWSRSSSRVSENELVAWLRSETPGPLTLDRVESTIVPQSDGSCIVKFAAHASVFAALYERENTAGYLRRTLGLTPASASVLRDATQAAADPRIRERAGISDTPADPLDAIVLRETTAAGGDLPLSGVATARKHDGRWTFSLLQGSLSRAVPRGQPRASFGEKNYVAGSPADDEALRKLVALQADFIARIEKIRTESSAETKRDRESRLANFQSLIAPGSLFTGQTAKRSGASEIHASLEITSVKTNASRQVAALLRNDGGWGDARAFLGTWKFDDTNGVFLLNLMSRSGQSIAYAGPLLETRDALSLTLQLSADGRLTSPATSEIPLDLTRVNPEDVAATKATLGTILHLALAATKPGALYQGTASSKDTHASESVLLRFQKQADDGTSLTATLESAGPGNRLHRPWRGAIVDSRYRNDGHPLRLQMPGSGRSRSAKPGTLFALATDTAPGLAIDGERLTGEDSAYTYAFTRVSAEQAASLTATADESAADAANAPAYPRSSGAYIEIQGEWTPLPRNGGSTSQGIAGFARGLFSKNKDADKPATLVFKGDNPPPVVTGDGLTLLVKGKPPSRAKGVSTDYPLLEAGRTERQADGTRVATLERITPGFSGFGATRLAATVAQPADEVLTLTFSTTLEPGTYALLVGTDGYEFTVE